MVGGGDSAVEAALGLAQQKGNQVTLSYRRDAFSRIKARNEEKVQRAIQKRQLSVLMKSEVVRIGPEAVDLVVNDEDGQRTVTLPNDEVFVMAGGIPPFEVLEQSGVSFDPADRPAQTLVTEQGTGLLRALAAALALTICASLWIAAFYGYYSLPRDARPDSSWHETLSPSGRIGVGFGMTAAVLIGANLAYLLRRSSRVPLRIGSLCAWMTSHVATGILVLLFALLHSAMSVKDTVGGHALLGLVVLVITGAIGRYFYSYVPRAANGRELALDEVRAGLVTISSEWDREHRAFGKKVRDEIDALVASGRWKGSFASRVMALVASQFRLRRLTERVRREGAAEGIPRDQLRRIVDLARRAQRNALVTAHFEDLRALLATWRYLHRWVALLMVLLVVVHVFVALRYGELLG